MKQFCAIVLFFCCLLLTGAVGACPVLSQDQLLARLKEQPVRQLVFFASWCLSCKQHLKPAELEQSLYIATFDEREPAVKALQSMLGEAAIKRCIWDKDGAIASFYGVKSLPAQRMIDQTAN